MVFLWAAFLTIVPIKLVHLVGSAMLTFEYKHWRNARPKSGWRRRQLAEAMKLFALLASPRFPEQTYPGRYLPVWVTNLLFDRDRSGPPRGRSRTRRDEPPV
ncbi:hypothetical protein PLIIFM63780_008137 [Purpureocillium lilacinum]|nr:hypothetical protein PLIIFM63780_008137 [Purpureocillium lilacinum]